MKYHTKIIWELPCDPIEFPKMLRQEVSCPNCRCRLPVPPEFTDWRLVADKYEEMYYKREKDFFRLLEEAGQAFDVPLVEYFKAHQMDVINRIKEMVEMLKNKESQ